MTSPRLMSAGRGMLSAMAADANSGLVRLIIGPAEFLAERAVAEGLEAADKIREFGDAFFDKIFLEILARVSRRLAVERQIAAFCADQNFVAREVFVV